MQWRRTQIPQTDDVTSGTASPPMPRRKRAGYAFGALVAAGAIWFMYSVDPVQEMVETANDANNGYIGPDYEQPRPAATMAPAPTRVAATTAPPAPGPPANKEAAGWMPNIALGPTAAPRPPPTTAFQASQGIKKTSAVSSPSDGRGQDRGQMQDLGQGTEVSRQGGRSEDRLDAGLSSGQDGGTIRATVLPDRHLFLTMGTPIACDMQQPIDTQVPGPFRCKVRGDVKGASGAVTLLDDGTWAFGRVTKSLERGVNRAFAVITRLETPTGCLVKLRAPVGDQLGTPGVEGDVDTHFFERFRGVAVLALLDAAGQAAAIAASNAIGASTGISFNQFESGTRQLGQATVGDDINIPSTLKRHQAASVLIMPIDDIDMRSCFQLRVTN
jgi:type IV secretion system protein VirB10